MESLILCALNLTEQELVKIPNSRLNTTTTTRGSPEPVGKMLWGRGQLSSREAEP